jgi:hypothetical protein
MLLIVGLVFGVSFQLSACASSGGHTASTPAELSASELVPGAPRAMVLERYGAIPQESQVVARVRIDDATVVKALTEELNGLPPVPLGRPSCPNDNGSRMVATLIYAHQELQVQIALSGCPEASRGALRRWGLEPAGSRLIARLERLAARRPGER